LPASFPEKVRRDLLESLHARQVNHKFITTASNKPKNGSHYIRRIPRTQRCGLRRDFDRGFAAAADGSKRRRSTSSASAAAAGKKDTRLLKLLKKGRRANFTRRAT